MLDPIGLNAIRKKYEFQHPGSPAKQIISQVLPFKPHLSHHDEWDMLNSKEPTTEELLTDIKQLQEEIELLFQRYKHINYMVKMDLDEFCHI
ncbi:HBR102Wp [Eremothecium sinecaudum]|uniref:HBR102Wp n=1 Tax=Eremothecium sinecaudum TaxID=45286 RepID=A0A109UWT5_9SACH|nr:HBR102Wp [Eremothecium sinecaudum]AMD19003.1 HBR102Wp [Eremothecium sinecaudum]